MGELSLEQQLVRIGELLPQRIERIETPPPEEVYFSPIYYHDSDEWGVQIGANYGGWIDRFGGMSEGPVYLGRRFASLSELATYMLMVLTHD